ncbi:hypothetical protein [Terricaulis sp.]|uniref:hypothetical protein n=1 Tax=Terricaulis sp. TaxID=2768686 RepID=UPI003783F8F7
MAKKFQVFSTLLSTGQPKVLAETDDPAEALRHTRDLAKGGYLRLSIGLTGTSKFWDPQAFAQEHKLR